MDKKKVKYVKSPDSVSSKLRMFLYSGMQDYKINSKYIDMICSENNANSANDKLEDIVRASLIREFSPEIQKMKSYDFLVDAVVHNLKKKQLANYDALYEEVE